MKLFYTIVWALCAVFWASTAVAGEPNSGMNTPSDAEILEEAFGPEEYDAKCQCIRGTASGSEAALLDERGWSRGGKITHTVSQRFRMGDNDLLVLLNSATGTCHACSALAGIARYQWNVRLRTWRVTDVFPYVLSMGSWGRVPEAVIVEYGAGRPALLFTSSDGNQGYFWRSHFLLSFAGIPAVLGSFPGGYSSSGAGGPDHFEYSLDFVATSDSPYFDVVLEKNGDGVDPQGSSKDRIVYTLLDGKYLENPSVMPETGVWQHAKVEIDLVDAWINVFSVPAMGIHSVKKGHAYSSSGKFRIQNLVGPNFSFIVGRSKVGFGIGFDKSAIAGGWREQVPHPINYRRIEFRGGEGGSIDAGNGCRYATAGIRGTTVVDRGGVPVYEVFIHATACGGAEKMALLSMYLDQIELATRETNSADSLVANKAR